MTEDVGEDLGQRGQLVQKAIKESEQQRSTEQRSTQKQLKQMEKELERLKQLEETREIELTRRTLQYDAKNRKKVQTDPIHCCINRQYLGVLEDLLDAGDIEDDGSALVYSCLVKRFPFTRLLLERFGDRPGYVDHVDWLDRSPLYFAIGRANIKLLRLLLDYGVYIGPRPMPGLTGLHTPLSFLDLRRKSSLRSDDQKRRLDAMRTMLFQLPAIRGDAWCWPMSGRVYSGKSRLNPELSRMLSSMRRRAGRRPIIVRVSST